MANKRGTDGHTNFGANFVFAQGAESLYDVLDHVQAGKLYITGANEVKATGTFEKAWTSATDPNYIGFSPVVNPSGAWWVSTMSNTGFVVTFATAPRGAGAPSDFTTPGLYVGDWFACM